MSNANLLRTSLVIACVTGAVAIICYDINFGLHWSSKTNDWGTFGDYVGGVIGTVFNLVGIVLIYLTFRAQMRFASVQLDRDTIQQFESTFFNLLSTQRDIAKELAYGQAYPSVEPGYAAIGKITEELKGIIKDIPLESDIDKVEGIFKEAYRRIYVSRESQLGHYFRHLYHILKYTHEALIANKRKYVDILQAQMSDDELYLAFFNGISPYGSKLRTLMEEYQFLENLHRNPTDANFNGCALSFYPKTFKQYFSFEIE